MKPCRFTVLVLLLLTLVGCGGGTHYAPVTSAYSQGEVSKGIYIVRPGDTLYAVAWLYNHDFHELAAMNRIPPPYTLKTGQRLVVSKSSYHPTSIKILNKTRIKPIVGINLKQTLSNRGIKTKTPAANGWVWPTAGQVIHGFSPWAQQKGIEIAGRVGQPVVAAASGVVAYSGSGIRGYGNLLIIKHNETYLSAYAHNRRLLVKEGQRVTVGQPIAQMGTVNGSQGLLHFEIRLMGKPINPLVVLRRTR